MACRFENRKTENLREKIIKFVPFVKRKPKMRHNKIHASVTTWPQEQFFNPVPILTIDAFLNTHHKGFPVKELAKFQILTNRS